VGMDMSGVWHAFDLGNMIVFGATDGAGQAIPGKPEKVRVHNPLGNTADLARAFDSMGTGCARVVNFSAW